MSDSNFIEKDTISQKKKNNLFKPILIGISVISISFLLFICLNMKNNSQIKIISLCSITIGKKICPDNYFRV